MRGPNSRGGRLGNSIPYAKPAQWDRTPSDEEINEMLEKLIDSSNIEVNERSHPFEEREDPEETEIQALLNSGQE